MALSRALCVSGLAFVAGQQAGTLKEEGNPKLSFSECTKSGGCTSQQNEVTIDQNWRWVHRTGDATNCYKGNQWD